MGSTTVLKPGSKALVEANLVHVQNSELVLSVGQTSQQVVPLGRVVLVRRRKTEERLFEALHREVERLLDVGRQLDDPVASRRLDVVLDAVDDPRFGGALLGVVLVDVAHNFGRPSLQ